jgi:hypothetical protein
MKVPIWTFYAASAAPLCLRTITEDFVFSDWGKAHIAQQCDDFTTTIKGQRLSLGTSIAWDGVSLSIFGGMPEKSVKLGYSSMRSDVENI